MHIEGQLSQRQKQNMNLFTPKYVEQIALAKTNLFCAPIVEETSNIGRAVKFKNPKAKWCGTVHALPHFIQSLQKNYKGEICYRVQTDANDFGRVAAFDDVVFI